jgi:hypothetical protein
MVNGRASLLVNILSDQLFYVGEFPLLGLPALFA